MDGVNRSQHFPDYSRVSRNQDSSPSMSAFSRSSAYSTPGSRRGLSGVEKNANTYGESAPPDSSLHNHATTYQTVKRGYINHMRSRDVGGAAKAGRTLAMTLGTIFNITGKLGAILTSAVLGAATAKVVIGGFILAAALQILDWIRAGVTESETLPILETYCVGVAALYTATAVAGGFVFSGFGAGAALRSAARHEQGNFKNDLSHEFSTEMKWNIEYGSVGGWVGMFLTD